MEIDQLKQLDASLERAIQVLLKVGPVRASQAAVEAMKAQPELWQSVQAQLATERAEKRAVVLIGRMAKVKPDSGQLTFPGFERVPILYRDKSGANSVMLAKAPELHALKDKLRREIDTPVDLAQKRQHERAAIQKQEKRKQYEDLSELLKVVEYLDSKDGAPGSNAAEQAIYRIAEYEQMKAAKQKAGRARGAQAKTAKAAR